MKNFQKLSLLLALSLAPALGCSSEFVAEDDTEISTDKAAPVRLKSHELTTTRSGLYALKVTGLSAYDRFELRDGHGTVIASSDKGRAITHELLASAETIVGMLDDGPFELYMVNGDKSVAYDLALFADVRTDGNITDSVAFSTMQLAAGYNENYFIASLPATEADSMKAYYYDGSPIVLTEFAVKNYLHPDSPANAFEATFTASQLQTLLKPNGTAVAVMEFYQGESLVKVSNFALDLQIELIAAE